MFDEDIPADALFFSVSGSTYHRRVPASTNTHSNRFRVCATVPILEHLHEVKSPSPLLMITVAIHEYVQTLKLIDNRVVKYLDKVAVVEYDSICRTHTCTPSVRSH